jgi:hypothetical protein
MGYLAGGGSSGLYVQHVGAEGISAAEGLVYADQAGMAPIETVPVRPPPPDVRGPRRVAGDFAGAGGDVVAGGVDRVDHVGGHGHPGCT